MLFFSSYELTLYIYLICILHNYYIIIISFIVLICLNLQEQSFDRIKKYNFKESQQFFTNVANKTCTYKKNKTNLFFIDKIKEIYSIFDNNADDNELKRNYCDFNLNIDYEALTILERKKKKRLLIKIKY